MKFIKDYYRQKLQKNCVPSRKNLHSASFHVLLLTDNSEHEQLVKKYFPHTETVFIEKMKRPKVESIKTTHLYLNDFTFQGEPKVKVPESPLKNAVVLNLEQNSQFLTWYWCARSYDYRVDLYENYDNADLQIVGDYSLEQKLKTVKETLERTNYE